MPKRDPQTFFQTITLPVNQILEASLTATGMDQASHGKCRTSIDEMRRTRSHWWGQQTLMDRPDPGDVEGRVNAHGAWKLECNHCWSDKPGSQLLGRIDSHTFRPTLYLGAVEHCQLAEVV